MKLSRRSSLALTAVVAVSLTIVFASSTSAYADGTITLTPASQTVEYGQGWVVTGQVAGVYGPSYQASATVTSGSVSKNVTAVYGSTFQVYGPEALPQLDLGTGAHSVSVTLTGGYIPVAPSDPVKVVVTAAAISSTTTIVPDPNNSSNAVITAQLAGHFIDQLGPDGNGYPLPAGTWHLIVTDSKNTVLLDKQQQQVVNGVPHFVYYWQNIPAGATMTATTTFTPASASAANFSMTAQKFSYTTAAAAGDATGASGSGGSRHLVALSAPPGAPTWIYLLVLLIGVILAAAVIVLLARRNPRRARTKSAAPDAGESLA
jgi:hypothetical protein